VTLKQLRVLSAVLKTGSMTGAARELNVTPPAITLQMQLLEQFTGLPLIERAEDGTAPTAAGEKVLRTAQRIEALLGDCDQELGLLKGLKGGRVAVAVVSTAKYFAPHALASFREGYPDIDLRLMVGNRQETINCLRNLDADIAIMGRPPEELSLQREAIGNHPHIIIASPKHALSSRNRLCVHDLARENLLVREIGSGTRTLMERFFAENNFHPNVGMEIGSNETIKQAVMAGLGIAFISAHTVAAEVTAGRISMLAVEGLPLMRQWFVVRLRDKRLLPAGEALWHFLSKEGEKFLPATA
jgi:LysR family transcriptional regulator for metE and metH